MARTGQAFPVEAALRVRSRAEHLGHAVQECGSIGARVEPYHIVLAQRIQQLCCPGQRLQDCGRHERRVKEEANAIVHAQRTQFQAEREQVVVVYPNDVVGVQQRTSAAAKRRLTAR